MTDYKPSGHPDISPYLILDNPDASLNFIKELFDGEQLMIARADDGTIRHSEIRIGDALLMISSSIPGWPAEKAHFHYFVEDVDAVFAQALTLGATVVQEPAQHDDPHRRGGFRDPGGITWWVATQVGQ